MARRPRVNRPPLTVPANHPYRPVMSTPDAFSSFDLLAAAQRLGYTGLPEVVEALGLAAERGHHLALVAGEGSGADLLIGLAAGLRCEPGRTGVQALVVTGTREAAVRDARAVQAVAGPSGLRTLVWGDGDEEAAAAGHVVCGRPADLLVGIRSGHVGLGGLELVVLDGLQDFEESSAWPAAESILDTLEAATQRIVCTAKDDARFRSLVDRSLPRARTWPPELLPGPGEEPPSEAGVPSRTVWTVTGATEPALVDRLVAVLRHPPAESRWEVAAVRCEDEAEAHRVADSLAVRGIPRAGEPGKAGVFVGWGTAPPTAPPAARPDLAVVFGLPLDLATLQEWLEAAGCAVACVAPRHLAQLSIMLRRLGWTSQELGWSLPQEEVDAIEDYRSRIRERADAADAVSQLSLLAPLLEELGPLRLLAGLSEMVRRQETELPSAPAPPEAAVRPAWTAIFLNVGKKDGAGPGDIVGAITGETPAVAAQIGKIDVRANHTIVELDSLVADAVIAALHGSRIKGRNVSARPDRGARRATAARPRTKSRGKGGRGRIDG